MRAAKIPSALSACYCKQRGIIGNMAKEQATRQVCGSRQGIHRGEPQVPRGIAHDLAKESEAGREHAEDWAEELVERGRRAAEQLGDLVRKRDPPSDQAVQPGDEPGRDQGRAAVRRAHDQGRRSRDGRRQPHGDGHQEGGEEQESERRKKAGEEGAGHQGRGEEGRPRPRRPPPRRLRAAKAGGQEDRPAKKAPAKKAATTAKKPQSQSP